MCMQLCASLPAELRVFKPCTLPLVARELCQLLLMTWSGLTQMHSSMTLS